MSAYCDVLIVDDDAIVRTMLRGYFEALSARDIHDAADGAAAAKIVRERSGSLDLIVTDLSMPDEDGIQFLRQLHDQGYRGDVVIASGRENAIIQAALSLAKGHNLQVRGHISKPLTKSKLDEVFLAGKSPVKSANTPEALDAAALVRGEHDALGHLGAFQLLSAARSHNMMSELTDIMAAKSFNQLSAWQKRGIKLDLALNIDPQQLCELDLPDRL